MILIKFSKIAMLHVVLDWQKIYNTVLEKAFFFIFFGVSIFYRFLCRKILNLALLSGENFVP